MDESAPYAYFEDVNWGLLRLWGDRSGLSILDVGCGFALNSERLRSLGNHVTGIESSAVAAANAAARIDEVIESDLRNFDQVSRRLGSRRFDVILFADVLEHLDWPLPVLKSYLQFLKPGGAVIVSVPNIGLWSMRLALLAGRFEYADTGVMDRTHLRFFTRRSARRLIEEAGLSITGRTYNPGVVRPFVPLVKKLISDGDPAALVESPVYRTYLKTIYPLERMATSLWPGMLAFQLIFEARAP